MSRGSLRAGCAAAIAVIALLAGPARVTSASASPPCKTCSPWWHVATSTVPAHIAPGAEGTIIITAANIGDKQVQASPEHPVVISDVLPPGVSVAGAPRPVAKLICSEGPVCGGIEPEHKGQLACSTISVSCTLTQNLAPYQLVQMLVAVKVDAAAAASLPNEVKVEGGGAKPVTLLRPISASHESTAFGVEDYELAAEGQEGETGLPATQAGSHPFQLTTTLALNEIEFEFGAQGISPSSPALVKNLHVDLPAGVIGNATEFPQCSVLDFTTHPEARTNLCPADTAVGVAVVRVNEPLNLHVQAFSTPVFNLAPADGEPARLGFQALNVPVVLDTAVKEGDYHVVVAANATTQAAALLSSEITIWGVPGDTRHDQSRGFACLGHPLPGETCTALEEEHPVPFLTLPTSCSGPLQTSVKAQSWVPGASFLEAVSPSFTGEQPGTQSLSGCERLPFDPTVSVQPIEQAASTPTGLNVELKVPQATTLEAEGLAEANVKDTTITFPAGMQLSPSAANGRASCSLAAIGFEQRNPRTGTLEFSPDPASCPDASKLGTVAIHTPLLENELHGDVYLAAQGENPFGSNFAIYIVVEDKTSGVLVKLAGEVTLDEHTGQVTSTFLNAPQLPFDDFKVQLSDGPRAPVATPRRCGTYATQATLAPWSGSAAVPAPQSLNEFTLNAGPDGSSCPAGALAFNPGFLAGTSNHQAGAFTPFTLSIGRPDTDQALSSVQVKLPPGLAGYLSKVKQCPEPQAEEGTCGPESLIGSATAVAGLGEDPITEGGGRVYVTGPYHGSPFGLSIVIPAKAGPFDFGYVVTRSTIDVDPVTAALTINSALPTMVNSLELRNGKLQADHTGVPVQLRRVDVTVQRPGNEPFEYNPTNCSPLSITGTLGGDEGAAAAVASPFQVEGCDKLSFKPILTAATSAKVSRLNGTSLKVIVRSGAGQANIAKTKIVFPSQLPSRLSTIQKACPESVFAANPAACPEGSVIGSAIAHTPVLNSPLAGPAYLVSHGGAAFPDAEFVLQGEGVTLILDGQTNIHKGVTSSTFNAVPDAPVSVFEVTLPAGPHSAFTGYGNMCPVKTVTRRVRVTRIVHGRKVRRLKTVSQRVTAPLSMPTRLTGQNGDVIAKTLPLTVTGCPKPASAKTKGRKSSSRRHRAR